VLTPCARGTAAFKWTPSGQAEGLASETALLIKQEGLRPLLPLERVLLRYCLQTAGGSADAGYSSQLGFENKASAMRRGVTQLAPRLVSVMRTEAGLLGRSMATVRAACGAVLELPSSASPCGCSRAALTGARGPHGAALYASREPGRKRAARVMTVRRWAQADGLPPRRHR
jgi:hypothetical protein